MHTVVQWSNYKNSPHMVKIEICLNHRKLCNNYLEMVNKRPKIEIFKGLLRSEVLYQFSFTFLVVQSFSQPPAKNKKIRYNILISMTLGLNHLISFHYFMKNGNLWHILPMGKWFFLNFFFWKRIKKILRKKGRWNYPRMLFLLCWRNHPDYSANLNIYGKPFEACQLQERISIRHTLV